MRRARAGLLVGLLLLAGAPRAHAWSFEGHRFVTEGAIALLPPELRPFFERYRVFVVEHSIDPDLYRNVGFTQEPPNHFLDLDAYGPPPFTSLPRDYDAAVKKFGVKKVTSEGLIPWRSAEIYGKLVRAFQQVKDPAAPYAFDDIKLFAAVIAHYVGDANQPFHSAKNYDGQLTNQNGIHSRFELELFRRYQGALSFQPGPVIPIRNARDFVFDTLSDSFTYVPAILAADKRAVAGRSEYDDAYFELFFKEVRSILERRMSGSMTGIASVITAAWIQAGRPAVPLTPRRAPNRRVGVPR